MRLFCNLMFVSMLLPALAEAIPPTSRYVLVNPARLSEVVTEKNLFEAEKQQLATRAKALIKEKKIFSITSNNAADDPNRHNYFSMGPYWWPNPKTENGLPYVMRDGQVNPERDKVSDRDQLGQFLNAVETLALAYIIDSNDAYAEHAVKLIDAWFIEEATFMAPNMVNAQAVPGVAPGRGTGIIDTQNFALLVDYVTILKGSRHWAAAREEAINDWFSKYLIWLQTHKYGKDESKESNNHGTAFDKQAIAIALFLGKQDWAKQWIESRTKPRIDTQIAASGEQPLETKRTKSWNYTCENMDHFFLLALMAKSVDVDLFNHLGSDRAGLQKALDYALPYAEAPKNWPHKMIVPFQPERLQETTLIAELVYGGETYDKAIERLNWKTMPLSIYIRLPSMQVKNKP